MGEFDKLLGELRELQQSKASKTLRKAMPARVSRTVREQPARPFRRLSFGGVIRRLEEIRRLDAAPERFALLIKAEPEVDSGADERRARELLHEIVARGTLSAVEAAKLESEINNRVGLVSSINAPLQAINRPGGDKVPRARPSLSDWSDIPPARGQMLG